MNDGLKFSGKPGLFTLKLLERDFLTTFMGDGLFSCKKCKKDCLGHELMDCIQCDVCDKWLHADCASLKYTFDCYINNSLDFVCGDKCERSYLSSPLPFYSTFNPNKIEEFHPHRENYRCKICREECLGFGIHDCIQCDICMRWLHLDCTELTIEEFNALSGNDSPFVCSKRCEMCILPFSSVSLLNLDTISDHTISNPSSVISNNNDVDLHTNSNSHPINSNDNVVIPYPCDPPIQVIMMLLITPMMSIW